MPIQASTVPQTPAHLLSGINVLEYAVVFLTVVGFVLAVAL